MTVSSTSNKIIYAGNGATTAFPFAFATPAVASDIQVFFTDTLGNVTQLVNGPGSAQYQIVFNPPVSPDPTPAGGTVTYNPLGTPIPPGTSLTILRSLPLQQNTSLANQGTLWQPVVEQALDYEMMATQQVLEIQSRALVVPVSDPTPNPIPSATARANKALTFDSSGNPTAGTIPVSGTISAPMAPVVGAASLAAGRTAFGLGACAVENIGAGLRDDGSGNLALASLAEQDAISETITSTHHNHHHFAQVAINYTFGASSTFFNGFMFWLTAQTAGTTIVIAAGDRFVGMPLGQAYIVPPGATVQLMTDGAGNWFTTLVAINGLNAPQNMTIVTSVAAGALTIALKDAQGNDPSVNSPILYTVSLAGNSVQRAITGPLSITVPSGATLGTANGLAGRVWIGVFDGPSGAVIGVYNATNPVIPNLTVLCWDETTATNATAVSAGSTSAQTWYAATGLTARAFRIFGYIEFTEATAGTWASNPTPKLFGPGQRKPGDIVQKVVSQNNSIFATSSGTFVVATGKTVAITPQSAANLIEIKAQGNATATAGILATSIISRGLVNNAGLINPQFGFNLPSASSGVGSFIDTYDFPNTTSQVTYATQVASNGVQTMNYGTTNQPVTQMEATEIFG